MKINKIKKQVNFDEQLVVEPQACWNDCTEYFLNTSGTVTWLKRSGIRPGSDEAHDLNIWCYDDQTPKYCWAW